MIYSGKVTGPQRFTARTKTASERFGVTTRDTSVSNQKREEERRQTHSLIIESLNFLWHVRNSSTFHVFCPSCYKAIEDGQYRLEASKNEQTIELIVIRLDLIFYSHPPNPAASIVQTSQSVMVSVEHKKEGQKYSLCEVELVKMISK